MAAVDKSLTRALAIFMRTKDARAAYGPLRFWHIPAIELGVCDFQMRDGVCLIESGTWHDTPVALSAQRTLEKSAADWKVSLGFYPFEAELGAVVAGTQVSAVWEDMQIVERSVLPAKWSCNTLSNIRMGGKEMEDHKKQALADLVGKELADTIVEEVDHLNEKAATPGAVVKAAETLAPEPAPAAATPAASAPEAAQSPATVASIAGAIVKAAAEVAAAAEATPAAPPEEKAVKIEAVPPDGPKADSTPPTPPATEAKPEPAPDPLMTVLKEVLQNLKDLKEQLSVMKAVDAPRAATFRASESEDTVVRASLSKGSGAKPETPPVVKAIADSIIERV